MIFKQQTYNAGLYERLSDEDDLDTESCSIESQRQIMRQYCDSKGINIIDEYVDDGYSGTNFDRPSFKRMLGDLKSGKINLVITKDLSRLGRNYVDTGYYVEQVFDNYNVRYIAIDDSVDTLQGENMVMPIKNIMNDWYAKDISKKTKSSLNARAKNGQYLASKPAYGYKKSTEDRHMLLIDQEAAEVVKQIYYLASMAYGYNKIVKHLTHNKVLTPQSYFVKQNPTYFKNMTFEPHCDWNNKTIQVILNNEIYLGKTIYGKTCSRKIRGKDRIEKPKDEWIVKDNTHEPIISRELWDEAHNKLCNRKREGAQGEVHMFAGLLYCKECGATMTFNNRDFHKELNGEFVCGTYKRKGKDRCQTHYITYENVYNLIIKDIRNKAKSANKDEQRFLQSLENENHKIEIAQNDQLLKDENYVRNRIKQLDVIMKNLYEDKALGVISTQRYSTMVSEYESEQNDLKDKLAVSESIQMNNDKSKQKAKTFTKLIKEAIGVKTLDRNILNKLIKRVTIGQSTINEVTGEKQQSFDIEYDLC